MNHTLLTYYAQSGQVNDYRGHQTFHEKQSLKNADIKIAEIIQQLRLLDYKIKVIKDNDLKHLQQRIDSGRQVSLPEQEACFE